MAEGDRLIGAALVDKDEEILLCTMNGKVVRFDQKEVRPMGRNAAGVKGANLRGDDRVVDLVIGSEDEELLIACRQGYGKRTRIGDFRITRRGSLGVVGIRTNERNGPVVNAGNASRSQEVLFSSESGMVVRTPLEDISIQGRATQGVRLVNLKEGDTLAGMASIPRDEGGEEAETAAEEPKTAAKKKAATKKKPAPKKKPVAKKKK
mgnify:FL=1